jgi:hypothetical protein
MRQANFSIKGSGHIKPIFGGVFRESAIVYSDKYFFDQHDVTGWYIT